MYNSVERLLALGTVRRLSNRHREGRALGAQGLRMPLPVNNNTRYHGERALGAQGVRMPFSVKFVVALPQKNIAFIFLKLSTRVILAAKCNLYLRSKNLQNPHGFNMKRKHQNVISLCSFKTNKYHF